MVDPIVVGSNILDGRKKLGLSQSALGDALRVSHQAVSRWERGECLPDIDTLVELAKRFGTTIDELLRECTETNLKHAPHGNGSDIWKNVQAWIRDQISEPSYRTYFEPTHAFLDGSGELIVQCATPFQAEWLFSRYMHLIITALDTVTGRSDLKLRFLHSSRYSEDKYKARFETERASLGMQG